MLKSCAGLLLGCLLVLPAFASEPTAGDKPEAENSKQALAEFRDNLQSIETDVISKTIPLTTEEATAFWPVFKQFQTEQKAVIEGQTKAIEEYAADYSKLSDEDAKAYVEALLERDQRIHDLRIKYLAEYSKVIGPGKAARVIHISRRLGLASQAKLAAAIPLVH